MTSIHETAYPRIKSALGSREMEEIFTPSEAEIEFVFNQRRQPAASYALLLLLKSFQRLGYFRQILNKTPILPIANDSHLALTEQTAYPGRNM